MSGDENLFRKIYASYVPRLESGRTRLGDMGIRSTVEEHVTGPRSWVVPILTVPLTGDTSYGHQLLSNYPRSETYSFLIIVRDRRIDAVSFDHDGWSHGDPVYYGAFKGEEYLDPIQINGDPGIKYFLRLFHSGIEGTESDQRFLEELKRHQQSLK